MTLYQCLMEIVRNVTRCVCMSMDATRDAGKF